MVMKHVFAYDLECLKNFFSAKFANIEDENDRYTFIISSDQNDSLPLIQFISQRNLRLVSYNGHHYDDILINAFLQAGAELNNKQLYKISKTIIETDWRDHPQWLKRLKYFDKPYESVDLMKLVSVNKSRPSLKSCGIHLKYHTIQDFFVDPNKPLAKKDISQLLDYQDDDVLMTRLLYQTVESDIKLREQMSEVYNANLLSAGDSGISNVIFEKLYGIPEIRGTERKLVKIGDILPKRFKFETDNMLKFQERLAKKILYEPHYKFADRLQINNTTYKIGVGGLHSDDKPGLFRSTDEYTIIDADIESFYPNILLKERIKPAHLEDRFFDVYQRIVNDRVEGKRAGDKIRAEGLKIAINGLFGKTNFRYWWAYDPKVTFAVTIGGQIYLLDLIEKLEMADIEVISANTDGVTAKVYKDKEDIYNAVCEQWQERTLFRLEFVSYKVYARKDVNNYLSLGTDGKTKVKGVFVDNLRLTKRSFVNAYNGPILAVALKEYFVNGTLPEITIAAETDIHNFLFSQKTDKKYKPIARKIKNGILEVVELQKTNRWVACKNGGYFLEKLHQEGGKNVAHMKNVRVELANDINNVSLDIVDREYYVNEVYKIIHDIEGKQNGQMSLF